MRLSLPQLSYLQTSLGADAPIRPDGRSLTAFRPVRFSTGVLPLCLGSAQLGWGPFNILVAVKGDIQPGGPKIDLAVDVKSERDDEPASVLLAETLLDLVHGSGSGSGSGPASITGSGGGVSVGGGGGRFGIDLTELAVVHDKSWHLKIDVVLLTTDGSSALTAASLALRLALLDTRLPATTAVGLSSDAVTDATATGDGSSAVAAGTVSNAGSGTGGDATARASTARVGLGDYDVDDDFEHAVALQSAQDIPLLVVANQCGQNTFFDATVEEEQVLVGRLAVAVVPSCSAPAQSAAQSAAQVPDGRSRGDDRSSSKRAALTDLRQTTSSSNVNSSSGSSTPRICAIRSLGCEAARAGVQGLGVDPARATSPLALRRAVRDAVDVGAAIFHAVDQHTASDAARHAYEPLDLFSVL